ncbi:MAG: endonuclease/exonuclease/phosphatase family protein, partial [Bacteroidales bacterium]|nr:endonuclease/exonuclease/phosphatase family protein [Bacteroidales bacterium]
MTQHYISWWNLENLFDIENSTDRPERLAKSIKNELKGWDESVLEKKLTNLSWVIKQINNGKGPDILGVCEVENKAVIEKLLLKLNPLNRNYKIIHQDTKDKRGIDIAFIYDAGKYEQEGEIFSLEIVKRSATRDILQAQFITNNGNRLIILGNHWPSRSGGQYKSEPYRMITGETLSYWLERINEIYDNEAPVIVMGDFNDEPFNRSLTEYALSTNSRKKVSYGKNPYLYNLCYETMGERKGSYIFSGEPIMFDQILVTKAMIQTKSKFKIK